MLPNDTFHRQFAFTIIFIPLGDVYRSNLNKHSILIRLQALLLNQLLRIEVTMKGSYLESIFSAKSHSREPTMYIGKVAKITGATCKAIRLYEDLDLIPKPFRKGNYRMYSDLHIFLIHMIKTGQTMGFSLQELKDLTATKSRDNCFPLQLASQLLDKKRLMIATEIQRLKQLDAHICEIKTQMLQIFT